MADEAADIAQRLERLAAAMVEEGAATAVSLRLDRGETTLAAATAGRRRVEGGEAVAADDRFDLASLTKPFAGELARRLDHAGELPLATELGELWPAADPRLAAQPLSALLEHRAGLVAWTPLYARCEHPAEAVRLLLGGSLLGAEPGRYSDLDFILWGLSAERALGRRLGELVAEHLEPELGENLRPGPNAVECVLDNAREVELAAAQGITVDLRPGPPPGVPQDGNARFLGGVAGHAGLFGSAGAVARLALGALRAAGGAGRASGETLPSEPELGFSIGWARPVTWRGGGGELGRACRGHLGFTGGSVWSDPDRERIAVLLAHRPAVDVAVDPWRRRFHRLAFGREGRGLSW